MADTLQEPETSEYEHLYAAAMAIRANPPARNPVKVKLLFNQDDAPTGPTPTKRDFHAELMALRADRDNLWNALYMPNGEVSRLRDALAEANGIIEDLHARIEDMTCALLSAQGGQP